jgi:hypothetical protein
MDDPLAYDCDFCDRTFVTLRGLRAHCCRVYVEEMDAARERAAYEQTDEYRESQARKLSREFTGDEDSWPAFVDARL